MLKDEKKNMSLKIGRKNQAKPGEKIKQT